MRLIALLALAAAAAAGAGCGGGAAAAGPPDGSTLRATWVDRAGDGFLERGPGEPLIARADLAPAAAAGRELGTLALLADAHVPDEESPARVAFLDRLGAPFSSTFRPHETLSPHVLDAAVRAIDAQRPDAAIVAGDLVDNAQANELAQALAVLRGGLVRPDSGAPGYDGVQRAANPDPGYYRPDIDPPRHPRLLAAAQRPFRARGLRAPWRAVPGNHDLLMAGEVARTARTAAVATGGRALVAPDRRLAGLPGDEAALRAGGIDRLLRGGLPGETTRVPADRARRPLGPAAAVARLRAATGDRATTPRMDAAFDVGSGLRVVMLDTVRRGGGAEGVVTPRQAAFVARALRAAGERWVLVVSHHPLARAAGGERVLGLLDRHPRALAALSGHAHRNRIAARRGPGGGYWLVQTAALADFPQQARMLRVRATTAGGAVLETWMLDTAPDRLADVARELAHLDAQGGRPDGAAGRHADRNARLFRPADG